MRIVKAIRGDRYQSLYEEQSVILTRCVRSATFAHATIRGFPSNVTKDVSHEESQTRDCSSGFGRGIGPDQRWCRPQNRECRLHHPRQFVLPITAGAV